MPYIAAATILISALAVAGIAQLDFNDRPRDIYLRADEASRFLQQTQDNFGADDNDILIVVQGNDLLSRESLRRINELVVDLESQPEIDVVNSLFDVRRPVKVFGRTTYIKLVPPLLRGEEAFDDARQRIAEHPAVRSQFLSPDRKVMVLIAQMPSETVEVIDMSRAVQVVRDRSTVVFANSSLRFRLTGQPLFRVETFVDLKLDQMRVMTVCSVICVVISVVLFRQIRVVLISLIAPGMGVLWTLGAMGWMGQRIDGLNVIIPTLLFVVGFTDSVHLVAAIQRKRRQSRTALQAVLAGFREVGKACFLTSFTTAIGFGSLGFSNLASIHRLGLLCALGAMLLLVAVVVGVSLLSMAPWFRDMSVSRKKSPMKLVPTLWLAALAERSRYVFGGGLLLCAALAAASAWLKFDMHWAEAINKRTETMQTIRELEEQFNGSLQAQVVVQWPAEKNLRSNEVLECLQEVHEATVLSGIDRDPVSVLSLLQQLQGPGDSLASRVQFLEKASASRLNRLVRPDLNQAIVRFSIPNLGARKLRPILDNVDEKLQSVQRNHDGFEITLTGATVVSARNIDDVIYELFTSLVMASAIIAVVLMVAFRSFKLGLISLLPNMFPLLAVTGGLAISGMALQVTGALTLCLCLGLAVDDTIHLVIRFQEERKHCPDTAIALRRTLHSVGSVLLMTTLILISGFSAMLLANSPAINMFGYLSIFGMVAAIFGDLLILPGMIRLFCSSKGK